MDVNAAVKLVRDVELRLAFAAAAQSAGRAEGLPLPVDGEPLGAAGLATSAATPTLEYGGPGPGAAATRCPAAGPAADSGARQPRMARRKRRRR